MAFKVEEYRYTKQFILLEDNEKKFSSSLYIDDGDINIGRFLYSIVTSVTQKEINGVIKHLIYSDGREIGWIVLEKSIPVYRFEPVFFKIIEKDFADNDLNEKLNINIDFFKHFKDKILTVKSQIYYMGEIYYSVFLEDRFFGFHHEKHLDPLFKLNMPLTKDNFDGELIIYKMSNLTKPVENKSSYETIELVSVFPKNNIGRLKLDKRFYWANLNNFKDIDLPRLVFEKKSEEQLLLDDIFYSIDIEKNMSKELVKNVLSAKNYLDDKSNPKHTADSKGKTSEIDSEEMKEKSHHFYENEDMTAEVEMYMEENFKLKRELTKHQKELKLSQQRLEQQKDYNERLESQKDKYKTRMLYVENKLENLNQKYKKLKDKIK